MRDAEDRVNPHLKIKVRHVTDIQQLDAYIEALGSWPFAILRDQLGLNSTPQEYAPLLPPDKPVSIYTR